MILILGVLKTEGYSVEIFSKL